MKKFKGIQKRILAFICVFCLSFSFILNTHTIKAYDSEYRSKAMYFSDFLLSDIYKTDSFKYINMLIKTGEMDPNDYTKESWANYNETFTYFFELFFQNKTPEAYELFHYQFEGGYNNLKRGSGGILKGVSSTKELGGFLTGCLVNDNIKNLTNTDYALKMYDFMCVLGNLYEAENGEFLNTASFDDLDDVFELIKANNKTTALNKLNNDVIPNIDNIVYIGKLKSMIEDIDSLNSNKYTAATWNVLEKVNIEAKKLLKNADSQKNVNETIKKLADLKNSLKLKSSSKDILKFEIKNQIGDTKINKNKNTISIIMPNKTDITKLTPTINVSEGASISPKSGESVDFSKPITYTVTAENGNIKKYTVTVRVKKSAEDNNNSSFKDDSEEANKNSHSIKTPNTSDYNNISLLYGLLIVSVLGISITFKKVFK